VNVELVDDEAEGGGIQLLTIGDRLQNARRQRDLLDQPRAVGRGQIDDLDQARLVRDEHEPGKTSVVAEQDGAKRQFADRNGFGFEPRIDAKAIRQGSPRCTA
jgi:hypothetical protein